MQMCPSFECMSVDPAFLLDAFPLDGETRFLFILFGENFDFFKNTWSRHLFLFYFFLRKNKIIKKTLSETPYLEKTVYGKSKLGPGVRLLIGKVR